MDETEISELIELEATKVSAVENPANATPWLLLKAAYDADAGRQTTPQSNLPRGGKGKKRLPPGVDPKWAGKPISPKQITQNRQWPADPRGTSQAYADRLQTGSGGPLPAVVGTDQRKQIASVRKGLERCVKQAKSPQERAQAERSLAAALSVEAMLKAQPGIAGDVNANRSGTGGHVMPTATARVPANDVSLDAGGVDEKYINGKRSKRKLKLAKQYGNGGTTRPQYNGSGGTLDDLNAQINPSPQARYRNKKGKVPKGFRQSVRWSDSPNTDTDSRISALKEIDQLGKQLKKARDGLEVDRLSQLLTLQQLRYRHMVQSPAMIPAQMSTVTKTGDDRIARLQKSHDKITDKLANVDNTTPPTRIAELQQTQRQISSELLLERLRQAHRAGRI